MKAYNHWDEMDEEEFEQILDELSPQDRELIEEQINSQVLIILILKMCF